MRSVHASCRSRAPVDALSPMPLPCVLLAQGDGALHLVEHDRPPGRVEPRRPHAAGAAVAAARPPAHSGQCCGGLRLHRRSSLQRCQPLPAVLKSARRDCRRCCRRPHARRCRCRRRCRRRCRHRCRRSRSRRASPPPSSSAWSAGGGFCSVVPASACCVGGCCGGSSSRPKAAHAREWWLMQRRRPANYLVWCGPRHWLRHTHATTAAAASSPRVRALHPCARRNRAHAAQRKHAVCVPLRTS